MERHVIALVASVAALGLGPIALAQAPAAPPSNDLGGSVEVSDAELETFADIYVDLQETASKYEARLLNVETEEEARGIQSEMQQESVGKVAERGWTPEQYVAVAEAINADPQLAEKTRSLIGRR
jgi:hypothetical protein